MKALLRRIGNAANPVLAGEAAELGERPARLQRSMIAWEQGKALGAEQRGDAALERIGQALSLSLGLGDRAGMAAANLAIAHLQLQRGAPAAALAPLAAGRQQLDGQDKGIRLARLAQYALRALASLRRPEALAAIERARQWDQPTLPAGNRVRLVRAIANAYASQGRYAQAFAEVQRSGALAQHGKPVNDSLGHAGGDAVLRALVAAAGGVLRGQDRLGRRGAGALGRWGAGAVRNGCWC